MKRNLLSRTIYRSLIAGTVLFQFGCSKSSDTHTAPTVVTNIAIADIRDTSAISGGVVTDIGTSAVTAEGVAYSSTSQTPSVSDSKTTVSPVTVAYLSTMNGLKPGTTYYARAYATTADGTGYGSVIKFTTAATGAAQPQVSTFAGNSTEGLVNGTGTAAQFWQPQAIAADAQGNLYVADQFNHVIRKITQAGVVTTFCGSGTIGHLDGAAGVAQFYSPSALTLDAQGNVYVADQGNNTIVKITPAGVATTIAGNGAAAYVNSTTALNASFNSPRGIAVDASGNIYVADAGNNRIRKITAAGVVSTLAGSGSATIYDATGTDASFNTPSGLAFDSKGVLYVADYNNHVIRKITVSDAVVTTYLGNISQSTLLGNPVGITFDSSDNLYIADATGRVLKLGNSATTLNTIGGTINTYGFLEGAATKAQFNLPKGVAVVSGNVFVADYNNSRIRKITGVQ